MSDDIGREPPPPKPATGRKRPPEDHWLQAWAWKREHRPDKVRFYRPYKYPLQLPGSEEPSPLTIHQAPFSAEGFASTVWDSAIVLAKYFEKHPEIVKGKRCLDLSAGCGLVGIVAAALGGEVTATDLAPNLPLLRRNCDESGEQPSTQSSKTTSGATFQKFSVICDLCAWICRL